MRSFGSLTISSALSTCRCSPCLPQPMPFHFQLHFCRLPAFTTKFLSCAAPRTSLRRHADIANCGALSLINRGSSSIESNHTDASAEYDFIVVNFYCFVNIENPELEVSRHLSFLQEQGLDIHGRVYVNEQGINAQYSGPSKDALAYIYWLREDNRFSGVLVQISPSSNGHTFPKLKLRYKPSLVQFEGNSLDLPLLDPSKRATPLSPAEWRKRLRAVQTKMDATDKVTKKFILLDVRNGYEWDIGHFEGAQRPEVDCFRSTSFGMSDFEVSASDPLANIDKDRTEILMYCTGGIRCDVYSTILRQKGFQNVYTLQGGVSHYLKEEGPVGWIGNLFVFDSRLALPPSTLNPESAEARRSQEVSENTTFAKCYACGSQVHELRHRNCANIDCNLLFLCCADCVENLRGCCCSSCISAPRLRPVLHGIQRYRKWHLYRDEKEN